MAQRTQVLLTSDVHEGDAEAVESVLFTVEGQSYEGESGVSRLRVLAIGCCGCDDGLDPIRGQARNRGHRCCVR